MRRHIALLPLLMTACQSVADDGRGGARAPDACGASAMQHLVGTHEMNLPPSMDMHLLRVLRPGSEANSEPQVPERLSVHVDEAGIITKVECG